MAVGVQKNIKTNLGRLEKDLLNEATNWLDRQEIGLFSA